MRALMFESGPDNAAASFDLHPLSAASVTSEKWLQRVVFEHPELIPIEEIDPGAQAVAPLCRELSLPRPQGPVYLDMLGVTRRGRLVLVECKLWRNPQARREVIGQILEYASLLKRLSFSDLSTRVAVRAGIQGKNPLWDLAAGKLGLTDEAGFVTAVSNSLERGEFDLVLVGDGIRSEIDAVRSYLDGALGARSRLALIEIRTLAGEGGRTLVVPQLAMRTQVVEHRAEFEPRGATSAQPEPDDGVDGPGAPTESADDNRAFWQHFIDGVHFQHPDQPPARHGGNNWARLPLPKPFSHVTAYRSTTGRKNGLPHPFLTGVFVKLTGEPGRAVFEAIAADQPGFAEELGLSTTDVERLRLRWDESTDTGFVAVDWNTAEPVDEGVQLPWLCATADRFISALRPRLTIVE